MENIIVHIQKPKGLKVKVKIKIPKSSLIKKVPKYKVEDKSHSDGEIPDYEVEEFKYPISIKDYEKMYSDSIDKCVGILYNKKGDDND